MFLIVLLIFQLGCYGNGFYIEEPIIETPLGKVEGSVLKTGYSQPVYQFLGIRYAKLLDETKKSEPAQLAADKWKDVYNAKNYGTVCPPPESKESSEDCLFLNIFTTKLPENNKNRKRQVLVLLYPGGYRFGEKSEFDPRVLLDEDMIIVAVNYRLTHISGTTNEGKILSRGVQDQALALKWVKDNIEAFGGNSNSITACIYNIGNFHTALTDLVAVTDVTFMKVFVMTVEHT